MTTLNTITTIELSSLCNLKCKYCIQDQLIKDPFRKPGIMRDEIFDKTVEVLTELCNRGTQKEVNINGNGESLIDFNIVPRVRRLKKIVGSRPVQFSTNGILMTELLAKQLKDAGIDKIDISPHSVNDARRCVDIFRTVLIPGVINLGAINAPHNWAGQLGLERSVKHVVENMPCHSLIEGRGYVYSEGHMACCCYCFSDIGIFGNIFDPDILDRKIEPHKLCETCHQVIPDSIKERSAA